jgi:hypothetical protein
MRESGVMKANTLNKVRVMEAWGRPCPPGTTKLDNPDLVR